MSYRVILPKSVQKELDRLREDVGRRILARLTELETHPRPNDVKRLKGRNAWRIRVGDYRVIYEIHDRHLQILVITIGHRREVYRSVHDKGIYWIVTRFGDRQMVQLRALRRTPPRTRKAGEIRAGGDAEK